MSLEAPCEVVGVTDIKDGALVPFIVVRMRNEADGREKFLLKSGENVSWEVNLSPEPAACSLARPLLKLFCQKYCRSVSESAADISLAGEGRLKHFNVERKIIIYSR